MSPDSAQRMARLLVLLKDGLEEFVIDRMRQRYGQSWTDEARSIVYRNMPQAAPKDGGIQWDVYALLTVITVRWSDCFAQVLSKRARSLVEELRATRNEIAHQHLQPDDEPRAIDSATRLLIEVDTDSARTAREQIAQMTKPPSQEVSPSKAPAHHPSPPRERPLGRTSKYALLKEWLLAQGTERVEASFDKLGELVGGLPRSAFEYQAWWGNLTGPHPQSKAWRDAGYRVDMLDLNGKRVRFIRDRN